MRPFGDHVPAWPPLAGVFALAGGMLVAAVAPLAAVVPALAAGLERSAPAVVLLAAILSAAGVVGVVIAVAQLTRPLSAEQLGLRAPRDLPRAALLALGAAAVVGAAGAAWALLGDPRGALTVPVELDTRSATAQLYDLPMRDPVPLGLGLLAGALAHCVLPVVAGEILLRGFALPALTGWKGLAPAVAIVSVLFGGLISLAGQPGLAAISMLLGVLLCGLYVATGSLLPGGAVAAAAATVPFGAACALDPATIAGLTVACTAVAVLLAALPAQRLRAGAPRRRQLRGSAA